MKHFFRDIKRNGILFGGAAYILCVVLFVLPILAGARLGILNIVLVLSGIAIAMIAAAFSAKTIMKWRNSYHKLEISNKVQKRKTHYFESILRDTTDIIFTVDVEGFILKFNPGAEANIGYSQLDILGKPLKTLFLNEMDEKKVIKNVLRTGKISNTEVILKKNTGEPVFVSMTVNEMKDVDGSIMGLVATCKNITEKKKLESELIEKNIQLKKLAITDGLTGLYNSRYFFRNMEKEFNRMKRKTDAVLSLLLIDVDNFKIYNDTYGHQAGDNVLRTIGQVINESIRNDIDTGYRYGGDEFTVLLPDTTMQNAVYAAKRICKKYDAYDFKPTHLSVGISDTAEFPDAEGLVHAADKRMYEKKRNKRK